MKSPTQIDPATYYAREAIAARLEAARQEQAIRAQKQAKARELYRSTGIHDQELMAALQNIHANLTNKHSAHAKCLMALIEVMDDEENTPLTYGEIAEYWNDGNERKDRAYD